MPRTIQESLAVAIQRMQARHDRSNPRHLTVVCMDLIGMLDACAQAEQYGAGLQRDRIQQLLPTMRGVLDELWQDTRGGA